MSMFDWAKGEIKLAKEIEKQGLEKGEFDYGGACYDSALEAFKSLIKDGHSGMSIGITHNILNRLIEGKPLTPIEDTDDAWNEVFYNTTKNCKCYQSKRMSSLFKHVYENGTVTYHDIESSYCIDIDTQFTCHSRLVQDIIDEMFPIAMPYMPSGKPIQVGCTDFLTDTKNGDFDTVGIFYAIEPNGTKIDIDRYFKEEDDEWVEIEFGEYAERHNKRIERTGNYVE